MARKTLSAPEPITESLGATLPEVVREEADHNKSLALQIADAEARFHDGEEYNEERLTMVANGVASRVALEFAVGGAALIRIKARMGHGGGFTAFVQTRCNFSMDTAQKMMLVAHALLLPNNQPRPLLTTVAAQGRGSIGKALALASLSREELDKLDAGEMVNGMTIGSIEVMSLKDMREEIAARDIENGKLRADKLKLVEELEAADKDNRRMRRGGVEFEEHTYVDLLKDITTDANVGFASVVAGLARLKDCGEKLAQASVPAHLEDVAKRAHVMTLNTSTLQLAESVARVIWEQEALFGKFLNDAPHRLSTLEGHGASE